MGGSGKVGSSTGAWVGKGTSSGTGLGLGSGGGASGSGVEWARRIARSALLQLNRSVIVRACLSVNYKERCMPAIRSYGKISMPVDANQA